MIFNQKAIDMHSHFNNGSPYDTKVNECYFADIDSLLKDYDRCNILGGVFSSFSSVLSDREIVKENEYTYKLSKENDRVFQWVVIDPRQDDTFVQADRMLKSDKCLGIKINPAAHEYDIMEYGDKIFSYANEKNAFAVMHPKDILKMPLFADKYKNMNLIIAHLRSVENIEAILNAKHGNVFTDTSGSTSYMNNIIEYAVKKVGSEKLFFGTDTYSCAFQYGRIAFADISDKDKENILFNNSMNHFGDKFRKIYL